MGEFVSEHLCILFTFIYLICFYLQLKVCPKRICMSTVGVKKDLFARDPSKVPITDFFGSVRPVEITLEGLDVDPPGIVKNIRYVLYMICF